VVGPAGHFDLFISEFLIDGASGGAPDGATRRLDALRGLPLIEIGLGVVAVLEAARERLFGNAAAA
jgi:hypothetical protein